MEVEVLRTYAEFEVVDIVDETNPYPALLGNYWDTNNQTIIKFKKRILSFKYYEIRVVSLINML